MMKRTRATAAAGRHTLRLLLLLLLPSVLSACSHAAARTLDARFDGNAVAVINQNGSIAAYAPAIGDPADKFSLTETAKAPASVQTAIGGGAMKMLLVCARQRRRGDLWPFFLKVLLTPSGREHFCDQPTSQPVDYIVRVPKQARAILSTVNGSVRATDVAGPVQARVRNGDIKLQIPGYADAATQNGNITVMFGDAQWPGTLHFSAEHGDVEVWVPATANAGVDLHTDHGTIFTDFDLRGSAKQSAETIVGNIGSGGDRRIIVRVTNGSIRLLKLTPQM